MCRNAIHVVLSVALYLYLMTKIMLENVRVFCVKTNCNFEHNVEYARISQTLLISNQTI